MKNIKVLNMNIYIANDYDEMSKKGAEVIAGIVKEKETPILGLATGGTPIGMYKELIRMNKEGDVDFSKTNTFNLDEYYPINKESPQSYYYFMKENLFNHINIDEENTNIPDGMASDIDKESKEYDEKLRKIGGVDIQVLGIGSNGHIGFNEPSDVFEPETHKVALDKQTIEDNARFFSSINEVPTEAITMGIGSIMTAKKILLLASGKNKATVIKEMILGKVTPRIPASILQFHPDVIVILDKDAASELLPNL